MRRGEIFLVKKPGGDTRRRRAFVVVSRQVLLDSSYETAICAPVYSKYLGLSSQVEVGSEEGLKHESAIHCDGLVSIEKGRLTDFVGSLSPAKTAELDVALRVALELDG